MTNYALLVNFPNRQVSVALDSDLQDAVAALGLGYRVAFLKTPGRGYHYTTTVILDQQGNMMKTLDMCKSTTLATAFRQIPNPHIVP